jgi:hypothetical protein
LDQADARSHTNPDPNAKSNCYPQSNSHADSNSYTESDCDTESDWHADNKRYAESNSNSKFNSKFNSKSNSKANSNSYAVCNSLILRTMRLSIIIVAVMPVMLMMPMTAAVVEEARLQRQHSG